MKKMIYIIIGLIIVGTLCVLVYMRYITKHSPSIIGGGYDQAMAAESAKRSGSKEVSPVFYKELKIISTYEVIGAEGGLNEGSGRVIAFNKNTDKLIWETIVYTVDYDSAEEKDVQDVYITKLSIENDKLIVIDELNRRHELNPLTGENETFPPYTD